MKAYDDLSVKGQVHRVLGALKNIFESEWGMRASSWRLVSNAYNMTFRVDTDQGRFAVRVNVASTHGIEKMLAEIEFVHHLTKASRFKVAAPISKAAGGYIAAFEVPLFGRPLHAVLYEWLPDPTVGRKVTPEIMIRLGQATRELHLLAESYVGAEYRFPELTEPYYGDDYRLPTNDLDLALFEECAGRVNDVFTRLESQPKIPIHADLHLHNVKFGSQGLSIFDFDDAMTAWPIMDAAITMWYFRYRHHSPEMEQAYWEGFGMSWADFGLTSADFETLVMARTLLLVNDIVGTRNAETKQEITAFVRRCESMLRHYLETNRFAPTEVSHHS